MDTLKSATTAELVAEIKRREKGAAKLRARRNKLVAELSRLDAELAALDLTTVALGTGGMRPRNRLTLADSLAAAIAPGAVVSPKEAAVLVRQSGYESSAANFNVLVATTLSKDERFKRIERGRYERAG